MAPRRKPATARTRSKVEQELQEAICTFFRLAVGPGIAVLLAIPNGEERHPMVALKLVGLKKDERDQLPDQDAILPFGLGVIPGAADFILLTAGHKTTFIEVKRPKRRLLGGGPVIDPGGTLSRSQKRFQQAVGDLGFNVYTVTSLEEFAAVLERMGVPMRVKPFGTQL
jgi:hypothetical protein